ncbi:MAG: zinc ribbon domain-containing protein, partial [Gemmatimonadales bacterium]
GCRYCGQSLPEDRKVNFCPSCGQNQLVRRCAACSADLEPDWKFCVACGRLAAP